MENIIPYLGFVLVVLAFILSLVALTQTIRTRKAYKQLFLGKQAGSLENVILDLTKKAEKLDGDVEDLFDISNQLNRLSLKGLSRIGLVRFNPYGEKGHKGCFSLALLNGKKKGIVFSTLTTEEGTKVFLKQVDNGSSDIQLTKEEELAIRSAK